MTKGFKGCDGFYMTVAFDYIKANGISTLKSYPYVAKVKTCSKASKPRSRVKVEGYKTVGTTESALQAAVGQYFRLICMNEYTSMVKFHPTMGKT